MPAKALATVPTLNSADVIVAQSTNPHRPGTLSFSEFAIYKPGMTVARFQELGGKLKDLRFHIAHHNCTMQSAKNAEAAKAEKAAARALRKASAAKAEDAPMPATMQLPDYTDQNIAAN